MGIFFINGYILTSITFLAFLLSLYKWKVADLAGRLLFLNVALNFTMGAYEFLITIPKNVAYHQTFFVLDLVTQCLFFNYCAAGMHKRKIGLFAIGVGLSSWATLLYYFRNNITNHSVPDYLNSVQGMINILLAIASLYFLFTEHTTTQLRSRPVFWFVTAILFCWATTYCFWGFQDQLKNNKPVYHFAVIFMLIMNDIYYLLLIFGYLLYRKSRQKEIVNPLNATPIE